MLRTPRLLAAAALACAAPAAFGSFSYAFFFGHPPEITLMRDAFWDSNTGEMLLTSAEDQVGAMWQESPQRVSPGFLSTFEFRIRQGPAQIDGDGFAFVLQNGFGGPPAIGFGGSGMGYQNIAASLAVEFDTFGCCGEPQTPHVAVHSRGMEANSPSNDAALGVAALGPLGVNILDERPHTGQIQYTGPANGNPGHMEVYIDAVLVLTIPDLDLTDIDGDDITDQGDMYTGFTAATGLADSTHAVTAWSLESDVTGCIEPHAYLSGSGHGGFDSPYQASVQFIGTYPMTFVWSKDGVPLVNGGRIEGQGTDRLYIADITPDDQGLYELLATNACGNQTIPFPLFIGPTCDPDFTCDGNADQDDVACIINVIAGNPGCECQDPDFNRDGNVDQDDVAALINVVAGGNCP